MSENFDNTSNRYLDMNGLKALLGQIMFKKSGTCQYWEERSDYIPLKNELIIYTDYKKSVNSIGIPTVKAGIKIGDGVTHVELLPFINNEVEKLNHSLTIGDQIFDGSADVVVPVYKGNIL